MSCFRLIIIGLLLTFTLNAEIYKWVDVNGVTHYSENKPENTKTEEFKLKSYKNVSFETVQDQNGLDVEQTVSEKKYRTYKSVKMYSAEWCGVCKKAKKYFKQNGIRYTEYDIDKSKAARYRYNKMGAKGVPVILVGSKRMNGFSVAGFNKIYK